MPSTAFHVVARTQGHVKWFSEPLCESVEKIIVNGVISSDARLLGYAVMPNHFHLVLRQAGRALGWIMQPIMRRIALLVQRFHNVEGHVFERAFRSYACTDAIRLRNAIIYTNLNPRRAGLCQPDAEYQWCTYSLFLRQPTVTTPIDVANLHRLFARELDCTDAAARADYERYLMWRIEKDRCDAADELCTVAEPRTAGGDLHFAKNFCTVPYDDVPPSKDLRDVARDMLREIETDLLLNDLRRPYISRRASEIRNQLIAGLLQRGYRVRSVADFFRVSATTVSKVSVWMRHACLG